MNVTLRLQVVPSAFNSDNLLQSILTLRQASASLYGHGWQREKRKTSGTVRGVDFATMPIPGSSRAEMDGSACTVMTNSYRKL
jgi:hypothetical protein